MIEAQCSQRPAAGLEKQSAEPEGTAQVWKRQQRERERGRIGYCDGILKCFVLSVH